MDEIPPEPQSGELIISPPGDPRKEAPLGDLGIPATVIIPWGDTPTRPYAVPPDFKRPAPRK